MSNHHLYQQLLQFLWQKNPVCHVSVGRLEQRLLGLGFKVGALIEVSPEMVGSA